jgi:hypothetical protein
MLTRITHFVNFEHYPISAAFSITHDKGHYLSERASALSPPLSVVRCLHIWIQFAACHDDRMRNCSTGKGVFKQVRE